MTCKGVLCPALSDIRERQLDGLLCESAANSTGQSPCSSYGHSSWKQPRAASEMQHSADTRGHP